MRALIKNVGASVNLHMHMQVLAQMRARIRGAGKTPKDVSPRCHDESRCGYLHGHMSACAHVHRKELAG